MEKYYLTLTNGRRVRVSWSLNVPDEFTKFTGKNISCFAEKTYSFTDIRHISWLMMICGERNDGREFDLSEIEVGRYMDMATANELSKIMVKIAFSQS